ncbi:MAG: hypothetical protein AB1486_34405 [Planctomycetota bacterium]
MHCWLKFCVCVCVCVAAIVVARARAQTENIHSMDPAAGERFGSAVAAAPLVGAVDWAIVGVPLAQVDGMAEAGEVECYPAIESPTTLPFKLKAPVGYVQAGAHFGSALAAADIDGDGAVDIVVGIPGQDVGLRQSHGEVIIYFGPWNPTAQQPWSARTILDVHPNDTNPMDPLHGDEFGYSVTVGDLDRQGFLDVVVGAPRADYVLVQPVTSETGAADVFWNVVKGADQLFRDERIYMNDNDRMELDHYGWSVGIGNFGEPDNEFFGDVVVGAPDFDVPIEGGGVTTNSGAAHAHYGRQGPLGPTWFCDVSSPQFFDLLIGTHGKVDGGQGTALAVGNYDGDSWDDLAVGSPGTETGPEGFVMIYKGDGTQLVSAGAMHEPLINEDDDLGDGTPFNMFGHSLAWADTDGTGQLDLLIGAPTAATGFPSVQAGRVFIAHAVAGTVPWNWELTAVSDGSPQAGQRFGWAVVRAARKGTSLDDIVAGSPRSRVLLYQEAGEIFVFNN